MTTPKPYSIPLANGPAYSGISRSSIYRAGAAGLITIRKHGRSSILIVEELERLVDKLPAAEIRRDDMPKTSE